ncbi:MAG: hypothetical protein HRU19_02600 [Pseudobacteriovorax sp.]|nr:hypothetical protein [Pseudobacteriovorax sp.]
MRVRFPRGLCWQVMLALAATSCSVDDHEYIDRSTEESSPDYSSDIVINEENIKEVSLKKNAEETVISTVAMTLSSTQALALTEDGDLSWAVDLEEIVDISGSVSAEKYLKVISDIEFADSTNGVNDIGCMYVELRDNVSYDKHTMLRIATTGIDSQTFTDVRAPLLVKREGWKDVPIVDESLTLALFDENTIKKFNGELCFRMDFTDAPAQDYAGQIIVQYLVAEEDSRNYDDEAPSETQSYTCGGDPKVLRAGQMAELVFSGIEDISNYSLRLVGDDQFGSFGRVYTSDGSLIYQAPDAVPTNHDILVVASRIDDDMLPEYCEISLIDDNSFFQEDDGLSQALVGNVFKLPKNTKRLPNFADMTPVATVMTPNFDVPKRSFSDGFPGVNDLVEWFGIRFDGKIFIPEDCDCEFKLNSDDGAILYIDGMEVIDNDGLHAPRARKGSMFLTQGFHDVRIDYYQGPRYLIALELFWNHEGTNGFEIVPAMNFYR